MACPAGIAQRTHSAEVHIPICVPRDLTAAGTHLGFQAWLHRPDRPAYTTPPWAIPPMHSSRRTDLGQRVHSSPLCLGTSHRRSCKSREAQTRTAAMPAQCIATTTAGPTQAIVACMTIADRIRGTAVSIQMTGLALVKAACTMTGQTLVMEVCTATVGHAQAIGACMTMADPVRATEMIVRSSDTLECELASEFRRARRRPCSHRLVLYPSLLQPVLYLFHNFSRSTLHSMVLCATQTFTSALVIAFFIVSTIEILSISLICSAFAACCFALQLTTTWIAYYPSSFSYHIFFSWEGLLVLCG